MQTTVRQLLARKGSAIWSTQPDAIIFEALEQMANKGIGSLLVFEAAIWPVSSPSGITRGK